MTNGFAPEELERLLGRPARASVGPDERAAFAGQRVLITGAAGSIGSELSRELTGSAPAIVGLVDQSELGLFALERALRARWPEVRIEVFLTDVTHAAAVQKAVRDVRPDVVFHAAAYKHVTMAERAPAVAARVNVHGSVVVARAAASAGARFVFISSDKAADPKSVMGATKRIAEMAVLAQASPAFRPIVVRFGNVIGSSGSVVELMRASVRAGQPIVITDPNATRYFMTASEAVALVLRADVLGRAAEIFWLDMGEPVRLGDLAARLLALEADAGYPAPPTEIIGLRPGEKCNETLTDPQLGFQRTIDRRILVARQVRRARPDVKRLLVALGRAGLRADDRAALAAMTTLLPGFDPSAQARDAARRSGPARAAARSLAVRRRRHAA